MPSASASAQLWVGYHCMSARGAVNLHPERWLSARESDTLRNYADPGRRIEWLRGRALAKIAVRSAAGRSLAPSAIEIGTTDKGAPFANIPARTGRISLSISHAGAWTACARLPLDVPGPVGVDVERVDDTLPELVGRFASPREWALAAAICGPGTAAALLWSAKESAIKCLQGRIVRRRAFEVHLDGDKRLRVTASAPDGERTVLFGGYARLRGHVLTWLSASLRSAILEQLPLAAVDELARQQGTSASG